MTTDNMALSREDGPSREGALPVEKMFPVRAASLRSTAEGPSEDDPHATQPVIGRAPF